MFEILHGLDQWALRFGRAGGRLERAGDFLHLLVQRQDLGIDLPDASGDLANLLLAGPWVVRHGRADQLGQVLVVFPLRAVHGFGGPAGASFRSLGHGQQDQGDDHERGQTPQAEFDILREGPADHVLNPRDQGLLRLHHAQQPQAQGGPAERQLGDTEQCPGVFLRLLAQGGQGRLIHRLLPDGADSRVGPPQWDMVEIHDLQQGLEEAEPEVAPPDMGELMDEHGPQLRRPQLSHHSRRHQDHRPAQPAHAGAGRQAAQPDFHAAAQAHLPAALFQ